MTDRTEAEIIYSNSRNGYAYHVSDRIESLSYTDNATGDGDTVDVTMYDVKGKFLRQDFPGKHDSLTCKLKLIRNDGRRVEVINAERFNVDGFEYGGAPGVVTVKGISTPMNSAFSKTPRTRAWKADSIYTIAKKLCDRANIALWYLEHTPNYMIASREQSGTTDLSYLYSLIGEYGLAMKIYANRLIIFDEKIYEEKPPVMSILPSDIVDGSFKANIGLIKNYTGYKGEYKTGDTDRWYSEWMNSEYPQIINDIGSCDSLTDVKAKGRASVNEANKELRTVSFTIPGTSKLIATSTISLAGYGSLDGKYYVTRVTHSFSAESGYTQAIDARKVERW